MTWLGKDDDLEYSTPEDARRAELAARVVASGSTGRTNPWIVALGIIVGVGFVVGVILMIVGTSLEASYRLNGYGDPGLGELVWGSALAGLGLSALFPLFAAQAVIWHMRSSSSSS